MGYSTSARDVGVHLGNSKYYILPRLEYKIDAVVFSGASSDEGVFPKNEEFTDPHHGTKGGDVK